MMCVPMLDPVQIAVVEDSDTFRRLYQSLLGGFEHCSVSMYASAEQAIQGLPQHPPDLLILDYVLPGMNGLELLETLNQAGIHPEVLLVTGQNEREVQVKALRLGVTDIISKPLDDVLFHLRVRMLLQGIREHQARLRQEHAMAALSAAAPIGMALLAADGRCISLNPALSRLLGCYPPLPSDYRLGLQLEQMGLQEGSHWLLAEAAGLDAREALLMLPDGREQWLRLHRACNYGPEGERTIWLHVEDIQVTRQLLRQLQESQLRLQFALELAEDGMWEWDIPSGNLQLNPRWLSMLGLDESFPHHVSAWESLVHPDDAAPAWLRLQAMLNGEAPAYEFEHRLRHRDGHWVWVLGRAKVVVHDSAGKPLRVVGTNVDVSARRHALEASMEMGEKLQMATATAGIGIWELDLEHNQARWDAQTYRLFGTQPDDARPPQVIWNEQLNEAERKRLAENISAARLGDGMVADEFNVNWPDGSQHVLQVHARVSRKQGGGAGRLIGVNIDVTEDRQREQALAEAEARWRFALEGSGDGVWDWQVQHGDAYLSPRWLQMLGYEPDELPMHIGTWLNLLHPEDKARALDAVNACIDGVVPHFQFECRMRNRLGGYQWVLDRGTVIERDGAGKAVRMIGTHSDLTRLYDAESALRRSEARLLDITDHFPGVIYQWVYNTRLREGTFTYVSSRHQDLFGITAEDIMMNDDLFTNCVHPDDRQAYLDSVDVAVRDAAEWRYEGRFCRPDSGQEIWWQGASSPQHEEGLLIYNGVLLDITERKRMERMRDEFVATVSHELRTPLTSILGSLKLADSGQLGDVPEMVAQLHRISIRNADRLLLLINDLLDMSKIESGMLSLQLEKLPLQPIVQDVLAMNQAYAQSFGVTLVLQGADMGGQAIVDRNRLQQVLTNLLSNASKFSPTGGQVTLAMTQQDGQIRLSVTDHGPGIPESFRQRLFSKFAQADASDTRQKGGTGLGLVITKALVERMGGRIEVMSEPNVATTFSVILPVAEEMKSVAATADGTPASAT